MVELSASRSDGELTTDSEANGKDRLKVLLIAYACSPGRGSEPKSGWNRAVQTQRHCNTWVICEEQESRQAIEQYGAGKEASALPRFLYVPHTAQERILARLPGFYYVAYNLWHRRAYRVALRVHEQEHFDIVHQATMCGYREPGYCWKLDAPFVWGPVGGTQNYPWRYLRFGGMPGALREASRSILNNIQLRFSPRVRKVARRSDIILAGNSTSQHNFSKVLHASSILMTTTGLPAGDAQLTRSPSVGPLRILWSGPHNYGKGFFLLVRALERVRTKLDFHLVVLGTGPENRRWRRMVRKAGIENRCTWTGRVLLTEALDYYQHSDVFAFTSLRDTAANVVLEALASGVPVVCFDLQGAADVVMPECGIKVPLDEPLSTVDAYGAAFVTLDRDRELLEKLSKGAKLRAKQFMWDAKVLDTLEIYHTVIDNRVQHT
jgi:glycosyltransferase involved in cell wall biosynthesis